MRITVAVDVILMGLATLGAHGESREDFWPAWGRPHANGAATKGDPLSLSFG